MKHLIMLQGGVNLHLLDRHLQIEYHTQFFISDLGLAPIGGIRPSPEFKTYPILFICMHTCNSNLLTKFVI